MLCKYVTWVRILRPTLSGLILVAFLVLYHENHRMPIDQQHSVFRKVNCIDRNNSSWNCRKIKYHKQNVSTYVRLSRLRGPADALDPASYCMSHQESKIFCFFWRPAVLLTLKQLISRDKTSDRKQDKTTPLMTNGLRSIFDPFV